MWCPACRYGSPVYRPYALACSHCGKVSREEQWLTRNPFGQDKKEKKKKGSEQEYKGVAE